MSESLAVWWIAMANDFGANINLEDKKKFFEHPANKKLVYIILDACHMLKLVINMLRLLRDLVTMFDWLIKHFDTWSFEKIFSVKFLGRPAYISHIECAALTRWESVVPSFFESTVFLSKILQ